MMPEAAPYWQKSLNQESFPLDSSLMPLEAAQQVAQGVFTARSVTTMDQFLALTNAQVNANVPAPAGFGYKLLSPVIDNVVIKDNYYQLLLDGLWKGKKIILGSNNGTYDQMYSIPGTAIATARNRNQATWVRPAGTATQISRRETPIIYQTSLIGLSRNIFHTTRCMVAIS